MRSEPGSGLGQLRQEFSGAAQRKVRLLQPLQARAFIDPALLWFPSENEAAARVALCGVSLRPSSDR